METTGTTWIFRNGTRATWPARTIPNRLLRRRSGTARSQFRTIRSRASGSDDGVRDSMAGYDTTPVEDARLKQENPEDAYAGQAENTIKTLRQLTPYFWRLHDPEELAKLKQELIESAMNEDGQKRPQPQPWLKSQRQRDDEFWNSEEPKRVMPRKL